MFPVQDLPKFFVSLGDPNNDRPSNDKDSESTNPAWYLRSWSLNRPLELCRLHIQMGDLLSELRLCLGDDDE